MWYDMAAGGADVTGQFVTALAGARRARRRAVRGARVRPRRSAIFGGFSQGGGLALALGLFSAPDGQPRVRPAGVLAMSPAAMTGPVDDGARACPGARAARHRRPDDPGAALARSRPRPARVRRPHRVPRVPDGAPGRARGPPGRARLARPRCSRVSGPTSPCPTTRSSSSRRSRPRSGSARCCAASSRSSSTSGRRGASRAVRCRRSSRRSPRCARRRTRS